MAKNFLAPINMNQNEIQYPVIHNLIKSSEPSGVEGQIYVDTTNHLLMFHNGTAWQELLVSGSEHDAVTLTAAADVLLELSTQEIGLNTQSLNTVFAGPASGGDVVPTFRSLVSDDLPTHTHALADLDSYAVGAIMIGGAADWEALTASTTNYVLKMGPTYPAWGQVDYSEITGTQPVPPHDYDVHTSTVPIADIADWTDGSMIIGGVSAWVQLAAGSPGEVLTMGAARPEWGSAGAPEAHALLSTAHSDTETDTPTRGSLIVGNATPLWDELPIGAANTIVASDGTDTTFMTRAALNLAYHSGTTVNGSVPAWSDTDGALNGAYTVQTILSSSTTAIARADAIVNYVDNAVAGGVTWVSGYNATTNVPAIEGTPTIAKGSMYTVTVGGDFYGQTLEVGDSMIANQANPTALSHWTVISAELADAFIVLQDTPSAYTSSGGFMVMVNSTPDALEFVDPSGYALSNFSNDLSDLVDGNGMVDFTYDGSAGATVTLGTPSSITETSTNSVSATSHEHLLDPNIDLSYFDNDLAVLTQTANGGMETFSYNGAAAETLTLDLNNLATVTTLQGADLFAIYDDSVSGTRNLSYTNILAQIVTDLDYAKKYTDTIGDAAATQFDKTHGLGSQFVVAQVFRVAAPYDEVECDIEQLSSTQTRFKFAVAPTLNEYRVVIIG